VFKKVHSGRPLAPKARSPTYCALQGVKPSPFVEPTEARTFLRFRPRLKITQACALWKKIMGDSKKGTHIMEKQKYL